MINFVKTVLTALIKSLRAFKIVGKSALNSTIKVSLKLKRLVGGATIGSLQIGKYIINVPKNCVFLAKHVVSFLQRYGSRALTISGIGLLGKELYDLVFRAKRENGNHNIQYDERFLIDKIMNSSELDNDAEFKEMLDKCMTFSDVEKISCDDTISVDCYDLFDLNKSGEQSHEEFLVEQDIFRILNSSNMDTIKLLYYMEVYDLKISQLIEHFNLKRKFKIGWNRRYVG